VSDLLPAKTAVGNLPRWPGRLHPEARLTASFVLLCFFAVELPRIFTTTAATAIFLKVYGAEFLPYTYLGAACAMPAVSLLYLRLQAHLPYKTLLLATLAADLVTLAALRLGLLLTDAAWVAMAAAIWIEVEWMLVSLVFWGLAERTFDIRQAKRLFGVIGAGEPLAVIIGGLLVPLLLTAFVTADLLWVSIAGLCVGIVLVLHIGSAYDDKIAGETVAEDDAPLEDARAGCDVCRVIWP
jgi:ATP:ADP antiporter, AAA family